VIASPWKITYDPFGTPTVLVEVDDLINGTLGFAAEQRGEQRRPIETTGGDFFGRGGWLTRTTITRRVTHASFDAALVYCQSHAAAIQALTRAVIRFQNGTTGSTIDLAGANIVKVKVVISDRANQATDATYEIRGGVLTT